MKEDTKEKILKCAGKYFATHGYKDTRTQDICKEAGVNPAAVNYHFGGKDELYKAVWEYAVKCDRHSSLVVGSKDADRDWLYNYLKHCIISVYDEEDKGLLSKLVSNEINNPSEYSIELLNKYLTPRTKELEEKVRNLLGPDSTDFQVGCCVLAIFSQFSALTINRNARKSIFAADNPTEEELAHFIREICAFVMGGIRAIRSVPETARRSHLSK